VAHQLSSDIKNLIDDLDNVIAGVLKSLAENKPLTIRYKSSNMGFDVTTNLSIRLGLLESLGSPSYDLQKYREPLIDVIEDDDYIKIIVMIPGIKKEDIETNTRQGFIDIKIKKGEDLISKSIPCNVKPNQLDIKSVSYNNSVLEIVFSKRGR
jgi:HSP20 family molecular chaperone IbpA